MWWFHPLRYVRECQRRFGDTFTLDGGPFGTVVYVADPEEIKRVFIGSPEVFHAGAANARVMAPLLGRHSVLVLDEERHLQQRRLMLPPFHGEGLARWESEIEEVAREEVGRWRTGQRLALRARMQWITLEVIMRVVIGARERARRERLRGALTALVEASPLMALAILSERDYGPWRPWTKFRESRAGADALIYEEIAARREAPGDDVLSMLIAARDEDGAGIGDEELRDELVTLLLAGHETTATGLAWAFERLLRHPRVEAELRRSLAAGEDEYLDAVVRETLRVRPVIMDVGRLLTEPTEVAGYLLRAGVVVVPSISLVHDSPRYYPPDPLAFRPERLLDGQPDPYTWIPFGGGRRRCLGASFAQFEMKVVLRTVLERAQLEAIGPPERQRPRNVTLVPSRGARARVRAVRA
jgi:cytochrome P450